MVQKTYKYRIYPNATQRAQLAIEFGHARFVWNWALDMRSKAYRRRVESLNVVGISKMLTKLKQCNRYSWLKEANAQCLVQKLRDQDRAFSNFFKGLAKYPRFKKRHAKQSVRYQMDQRIVLNNYRGGELLKLPKLGSLRVRWSRVPAGIPKMATVSLNQAGQYHVCLSVEESVDVLPAVTGTIGVDRGIKDVVVTSAGFKSGAPKYTRAYERRLAKAQRKLAKCTKGSNRRNKQRIKVARIHNKIKNSRHDFVHKLTSKLVSENQVIGIEDLNVKGMVKNKRLSKAIHDAGWHEFKRQLEYKCEWYGRQLVEIDRWVPTSKTCSGCGHVLDKLELSVRRWQCPECYIEHDRDQNAAKNILSTARSAGINARGDQLCRAC